MTTRALVKRQAVELYYITEDGVFVPGPNLKMFGSSHEMRGDCTNLRGDCTGLRGDCGGLRGNVSGISGNVSGLTGDCSGIRGLCSGLSGNFDECDITVDDRLDGVLIGDLVAVDEDEG